MSNWLVAGIYSSLIAIEIIANELGDVLHQSLAAHLLLRALTLANHVRF